MLKHGESGTTFVFYHCSQMNQVSVIFSRRRFGQSPLEKDHGFWFFPLLLTLELLSSLSSLRQKHFFSFLLSVTRSLYMTETRTRRLACVTHAALNASRLLMRR